MAIIYCVQGFKLKSGKLVAEQPSQAKTAESAVEKAERMVEIRAGVVAFSQNIDVETDTYDQPQMLFSAGRLPPGLFE